MSGWDDALYRVLQEVTAAIWWPKSHEPYLGLFLVSVYHLSQSKDELDHEVVDRSMGLSSNSTIRSYILSANHRANGAGPISTSRLVA